MPLKVKIPSQLSHLKIDERGYPVPYFVPISDGKPNFKFLDERKQHECMERHLCGVCGKKLYKDYCYFISGPQGLKNTISSDPPMHKVCAEFALEACPHIKYQPAIRKEEKGKDWYMIDDKPEMMILAKASKFKKFIEPIKKRWLFRYTPVSVGVYIYRKEILEFAFDCSLTEFNDLYAAKL